MGTLEFTIMGRGQPALSVSHYRCQGFQFVLNLLPADSIIDTGMPMKLDRLFLFAIVLLVLSCSDRAHEGSRQPDDVSDSNLPDQILTNSDILLSNRGVKEVLVHSAHLEKYISIDSTVMAEIVATFYDSLGVVSSTLISDSGIVREKTRELKAWGDVVVTSKEGIKLEADSLYWDQKSNRIMTESFVRITQKGNVQTGYGLESDSRLTNFRIKRDVKAVFEDVESVKRK